MRNSAVEIANIFGSFTETPKSGNQGGYGPKDISIIDASYIKLSFGKHYFIIVYQNTGTIM